MNPCHTAVVEYDMLFPTIAQPLPYGRTAKQELKAGRKTRNRTMALDVRYIQNDGCRGHTR